MNLQSQCSSSATLGSYYDGHLGLSSDLDGNQIAFFLAKITYAFNNRGELKLTDPAQLHNNIFDENESPRLKPGCDYWPYKLQTDIVLQGCACAPKGRHISKMPLFLSIGKFRKNAIIFGDRTVQYIRSRSAFKFSDPAPFETIDLTYFNSFGGVDWRVPVEEEDSLATKFKLQFDHPGLYPRNPYGKGYVVLPDPTDVDGSPLPNIENPMDLLTPERLITTNPRKWHLQPLPWCFDWVQGHVFPRSAFFAGADGWFPAPEDSVTEVQMRILPKNYRSYFGQKLLDSGPDPRFFNEASTGLIVPFLNGDEVIGLSGFLPEGDVQIQLPGLKPRVTFKIDGVICESTPKIHTLMINTNEKKIWILWGASAKTNRFYIEKIHKRIPIECRFNGDKIISFSTPLPILEKLKSSQNRNT